jgi:hypothetical protein
MAINGRLRWIRMRCTKSVDHTRHVTKVFCQQPFAPFCLLFLILYLVAKLVVQVCTLWTFLHFLVNNLAISTT